MSWRMIRTILVYAVVGALVTVGVAWGFAAWSALDTVEEDEWLCHPESGVRCHAISAVGASRLEWLPEDSWEDEVPPAPRWSNFRPDRIQYGSVSSTVFYMEHAFGWPCRSLAYGITSGWPEEDPTRWVFRVEWGIMWPNVTHPTRFELPEAPDHIDVVPLRPIPLGFAVNTAFYGLAAFVMVTGVRYGRRTVRRRRGRCPKCGHQLADDQVRCPECGT